MFARVHRGYLLRPRGHLQARHTPSPSSSGTPSPRQSLWDKTHPDFPKIPPLKAKPAGSRRVGVPRLTGGSFWGPWSPATVERGPHGPQAAAPWNSGCPPSTSRPRSVTCSPAAYGPNFRTKEAPRPQMAREVVGLSRAEPS